jgi:hypothetical protein
MSVLLVKQHRPITRGYQRGLIITMNLMMPVNLIVLPVQEPYLVLHDRGISGPVNRPRR